MASYHDWMERNTSIHSKSLKEICLPASHDSATYRFTNELSPDKGQGLRDALKISQDMENRLNAIPGIGKIINPPAWVNKEVLKATRGVSMANDRSIAQQLTEGIRCLDLRVYYDQNKSSFYTFHGLIAVQMTSVLDDIKNTGHLYGNQAMKGIE